MGSSRPKGKPKKKSIKAAISSKASTAQKLSRMGKKRKKGLAGLEATFIGRARCLKKLQLSLKDFRRLCILKGVYPRQPKGRVPGNKKGQSFYHINDIKALAHEPLLQKFRDFQAYIRKVKRAAGRNEIEEANRKNELLPSYTLHHIVKERYPRFVDALGDLDDALTLTYLFAALPSEGDIPAKVTSKAKNLAASWGAYCATMSAITKSFISVKGVYMEAVIQGMPIRWIIPHSFTQYLPEDVDYRVMMTFFEFYETLLNFVLFKLYNDIGVRYPLPANELGGEIVGSTTSILGANLRALRNALNSATTGGAIVNVVSSTVGKEQQDATENKDSALTKGKTDDDKKVKTAESKKKEKALIKSVGAALNQLVDGDDSEDDEDDVDNDDGVDVAGPLKAALDQMHDEYARNSVPGGAKDELDDEAIKRKRLFEGKTFFLSREIPRGYLELVCLSFGGRVGWEADDSPISMKESSITHHVVDRPKLLPSYSSLPKSREYIQPQWILDSSNFTVLLPIAKYAVGVTLPPHLSPWVDNEEEGYKPAYAEEIERLKNGEAVADTDEPVMGEDKSASDDESEEKAEDDEPKEEIDAKESESEEDDEDDDDDEEDAEKVKEKRKREENKRKLEEDETHKLAKSMMSRKASHLYNRMQHGIAKKQEKIDHLYNRRKEIEGKKKDASGKTVLKQKVERLKEERKKIANEYDEPAGKAKKQKRKA